MNIMNIRFFILFQLKNKYCSNNINNMENTDKIDESQDKSVTPNNQEEKISDEEQIDDEEQTKGEKPDEEQTKDSFIEFVDKTLRDGMDDNNKKAFDVLKTEDRSAFLKHVFTREDGTQRSYAEMRYLYG